MPEISVQGKTSDPFRTVNRSIRPFVGNLRLQEGVSLDEYPDSGIFRGLPRWILNADENLGPRWRKVGQRRRMKPFAVSAAQGESANQLGVKRLPANGKFRLLRIKLRVFLRENRNTSRGCRCILGVPFFALGDVELETVRSWQLPGRAGHRNSHFLIGCPNVPVHL